MTNITPLHRTNKFNHHIMHQNEIFKTTLSHQTNKFNINLCTPEKRLMAGENGCNTVFVRRKWAFTGQSDV